MEKKGNIQDHKLYTSMGMMEVSTLIKNHLAQHDNLSEKNEKIFELKMMEVGYQTLPKVGPEGQKKKDIDKSNKTKITIIENKESQNSNQAQKSNNQTTLGFAEQSNVSHQKRHNIAKLYQRANVHLEAHHARFQPKFQSLTKSQPQQPKVKRIREKKFNKAKMLLPEVKPENHIEIVGLQLENPEIFAKFEKYPRERISIRKQKREQFKRNQTLHRQSSQKEELGKMNEKMYNKFSPYKTVKVIERKWDWKKAPFPLQHITNGEFNTLMERYLKIREVKRKQSGHYRAYIGGGNNSTVIKNALKERGYWLMVDSLEDDPHLVWTQKNCKSFHAKQSTFFSQASPISDQMGSIEKRKKQSFLHHKATSYFEHCKKLTTKQSFNKLINQLYISFTTKQNISHYSNVSHLVINKYNKYKYELESLESNDMRVHNHIEGSKMIGNKKGLLECFKLYAEMSGEELFELIPRTVHVPQGGHIEEVLEVISEGPWIIKPGENTNRGEGISVHTNSHTLKQALSKEKKHKNGTVQTYIVQEYIPPMLYQGRKFDLRIWVVWSGGLLWWYKDGYARTCSSTYTLQTTNKFTHLTNDSIQRTSVGFHKHQPDNKLSFCALQKYLGGLDKPICFPALLDDMKKVTVKLFSAATRLINTNTRSFELFGLDFLIDETGKPWLIECNSNPTLQGGAMLNALVSELIHNMFLFTIDIYFPRPQNKCYQSNRSEKWKGDKFKFELIYDGTQEQHK